MRFDFTISFPLLLLECIESESIATHRAAWEMINLPRNLAPGFDAGSIAS